MLPYLILFPQSVLVQSRVSSGEGFYFYFFSFSVVLITYCQRARNEEKLNPHFFLDLERQFKGLTNHAFSALCLSN